MELIIILTLLITNIITITIAKIEEKEKRDLQEKLLKVLKERIEEKK